MPKEELVKIIPKPRPKIPIYLSFLFWFSLILLIALVGLYFFLGNQIPSLEERGEELEEDITPSQSQRELEEEMSSISKNVNNFSEFLREHKISSKFFDFLKASCHPKVQFTSLQLNIGTYQASLSGKTESFHTLGEQILVLRKKEDVKGLRVSDISLGQEGEVKFNLTFTFSENLIKR